MGENNIRKEKNKIKIEVKGFFLKYFKEILIFIMFGFLIFLLIKISTPPTDKSDILNYKLDQLDIKIKDLKERQKELDDSVSFYKKEIKIIDENIKNIRSQRTTVNNFYEIKEKQIPKYSSAQIDSALRKRYNY